MGDNLPTVSLGSGRTAQRVSADGKYDHTCALLDDDTIKCWGYNLAGRLGLGDTANRGDQSGEMGDNLAAVSLGSGRTATGVEVGFHTTCAFLDNEAMKCWGAGAWLGLGDEVSRGDHSGEMGDNLPSIDLGSGRTARSASLSFSHACALLDDYTVKCWGYEPDLGLGSNAIATRGDAPGEMGDNLPILDFWHEGCGDGEVQSEFEQCEDGNSVNGDGCDNNCTNTACGNGILTGSEECDDGNAFDWDDCTNECNEAFCGDGSVRGEIEQCDDGNSSNADACTNACDSAACGDGYVRSGVEACDDDNTTSGDGCDSNCTVTACGNGVVTDGEECDDGNGTETDYCTNECVELYCGDGVLNGNEECDDGNGISGDGCDDDHNCTETGCGNGVVTEGEECDDGNTSNTDDCTNSCEGAICGDGFVQAGNEQCDDANSSNTDACTNACNDSICGDGYVRAGVEQCDDDNSSNADGCLNTCNSATCGDGYTQAGVEQCDDANGSNTDACLNICSNASCGDGYTQAGVEQCDDANGSNTDACLNSCNNATCGDGYTQSGVEQCDDANGFNTDACLNSCNNASCGDGYTRTGVEQCDDANGSNTDACLNSCNNAACGDEFVWSGVEECDDGNVEDEDSCLSSCDQATCGDNVIWEGTEVCDDGNDDAGDGCASDCFPEPVQVVVGDAHSCARFAGGAVKCWGDNTYGQLGQGDTTRRADGVGEMGMNLPTVSLGTGRTAVNLFAGGNGTCAILDNNTVKCWGHNVYGRLGLGSTSHRGDGANEMGDNLPAVSLGTGRTALSISPGYSHTCALLDNNTVKCWGGGGSGQLGQGDSTARGDGANEMGDNLPAVSLGTGRTALSVYAAPVTPSGQTCALLDNNTVKCWGYGGYGQLGQGDTTSRGDGANEMGDNLPAIALGTGRTALSIGVGTLHSCALLDNNTVKCWGYGGYGQLGQGDTAHRGDGANEMGDNLPAIALGTGRSAVGMLTTGYGTCAFLDNSAIKCWGWGSYGQPGVGSSSHKGDGANEMGDNLGALSLGTGRTALSIAGNSHHSCALLDNKTVKCWGYNYNGQLGLGDTGNRGDQSNEMGDNLPILDFWHAGCGDGIVQSYEQCDDDNSVNGDGCDNNCKYTACGNGIITGTEVCDDGNASSTDACTNECNDAVCGDGYTRAGVEQCDDTNSTNGDGCDNNCTTTACGNEIITDGEDCDDGNAVTSDACTNSCEEGICGDGIRWDGVEECDDANSNNGDGCSNACTTDPVEVVAGSSHACARFGTGEVKCWGDNASGRLGLGHTSDRGDGANEMGDNLSRVELGTGRKATSLAAGTEHTCALLDDSTVKCWGENSAGQLGLGNTSDRGDGANEMGDNLSTVSLGTGRTALSIFAGGTRSCALLDNNTIKCWGGNSHGELGLGDTASRGDGANEMGDNLPAISLGTGRTAVTMAVGKSQAHNGFACALLDDSTLKCWGDNAYGQLGLGNTTTRGDGANEMGDNLPTVSLGTGRTALSISAGERHTCALLDNNTVKCWGYNSTGQLGQDNTTTRGDGANEMGDNLAATSLGSGRSATAISTRGFGTCALLDNNTLKCWGQNTNGQLGLGDTSARGDGTNEMGDNLPAISLGTGRTALSVSVGNDAHNCVILDNHTVKCWGGNSAGHLGLGDTTTRGDGSNEMGDNLPAVNFWY
jgi:cysteine-rich repeat protein